jgi:hypothetical protein
MYLSRMYLSCMQIRFVIKQIGIWKGEPVSPPTAKAVGFRHRKRFYEF